MGRMTELQNFSLDLAKIEGSAALKRSIRRLTTPEPPELPPEFSGIEYEVAEYCEWPREGWQSIYRHSRLPG
jgi:hypothetical protein